MTEERRLAIKIYDSVWTDEDETVFCEKVEGLLHKYIIELTERIRNEKQ